MLVHKETSALNTKHQISINPSLLKVNILNLGALTSKVYAFKGRPWEIKLKKTIDISDSLGSPISVETKNAKILRLLPRYNHNLKLEWCSDKARYIHEINDRYRLALPYGQNKAGIFQKLNSIYDQNRVGIASLMSFAHFDLVIGRNLDNKSIVTAKTLARRLGGDIVCEFANKLPKTFAITYASTKKLDFLEKAKSIFFLGVNPRWETTNANLVFRFRFLSGNFNAFSIGNPLDLTYDVENYGSIPKVLLSLSKGKHLKTQSIAANAFYAFGDSLSQRIDALSMLSICGLAQKNQYGGIYALSTGANAVGCEHLGLNEWKESNDTYFVSPENSRSFSNPKNYICETPFVDNKIKKAICLYPLQTYLEKNADYIIYDGSVQKAYKVLNFGTNSLQNLVNLCDTIDEKSYFKNLKSVNKNKYQLSVYNSGIFKFVFIKSKKLKVQLSCLKTFYGNLYNASSYKTYASPTLYQLSKLQSKLYFPFC